MKKREGEKLLTGFHHTNVLAMRDKLIELIQGTRQSTSLLGDGCDTPHKGMGYYEKPTELIPDDALIFSAACGKFRYNARDYGTIEGIPRFLDFGQCNNVYSIIQYFSHGWSKRQLEYSTHCSTSELREFISVQCPPEFLTLRVFEILRKQFDLRLTSDPEKDLKNMLNKEVKIEEGSALAEDLE